MRARSNLATIETPPAAPAMPDPLPAAELPTEAWTDAPLTWIGGALDRIALRGMRLAFAPALRESSPAMRAAIRDSAAPYLTRTLLADPRRFFARRRPPAATMRELGRRAVAEGEAVTRELATSHVPYHDGGTWPTCVENDRVVFEHWRHRPGPPRATVVALHGFTMGTAWIDAHVLMAGQWFVRGFDVALVVLPFHGPRCPRTSRYSGELFASWDVGRTNEAVR